MKKTFWGEFGKGAAKGIPIVGQILYHLYYEWYDEKFCADAHDKIVKLTHEDILKIKNAYPSLNDKADKDIINELLIHVCEIIDDAKKSPNDYRFVNKVDSLALSENIKQRLETPGEDLANKYLYLGSHGALSWKNVENTLSIKKFAHLLLSEKIDEILKKVLVITGANCIDIVSLGIGTGGDDIVILERLKNITSNKPFNFFAVDISSDLLKIGANEVVKMIKTNGMNKKALLHGICIDIDELYLMCSYFKTNRYNNNMLFHLLGLTLGNNDERKFLSSISKAMNTGDFLLLGVDFSADNDDILSKTKDSYKNARAEVAVFLSGPLKTAVSVDTAGYPEVVKVKGIWHSKDPYNYIDKTFRIESNVEQWDDGCKRLSHIPGTVSLTRYYSEFGTIFSPENAKLCDYSNKYKVEPFSAWLKEMNPLLKLELVEKITSWGLNGQHLVLLRKE